MAVKKVRKKSEVGGKNSPAKRKGKKGCLFWIILLGLLFGGAVHQRERVSGWVPQVGPYLESVAQLFSGFDPTFGLFGPEEAPAPVMPEVIKVELPPPPPPKPSKEPKKKVVRPIAGERLHYIRVGGCMDKECRVQLLREIESLNLPTLVKRYRRQTLYWELVSKMTMARTKAESKIFEIERHALNAPPATLTKWRSAWRVSLGEYPDKDEAVQMRSYLAQLYPDVDLSFDLVPRQRHFDMVYVYAGPFTSKFNAQSVAELIRDKRFVQETFVTPDP